MRISIHPANLFYHFGVDGAFKLMHENGVEGIQFGMGAVVMPAKVVRAHGESVMDEDLDTILEFVRPYKEAAKKYGVAISHVHAPFPSWVHAREDINARMADVLPKAIAVTEYMESKYIVVHPPYPHEISVNMTLEEEWELCKQVYVPLIPYLKKHKVMCLLENMFNRGVEGVRYAAVCSDFQEAAKWVDELNAIAGEECFGFCFDVGHCYLARQNVYRAVHIMGHRLHALHMQDNDGHLDMHVAPYAGYIDWAGFLAALRDVDYKDDLNFEAGNAISRYPKEMADIAVRMLTRTGEYFREQLRSDEKR